jgi:hypothetical protein
LEDGKFFLGAGIGLVSVNTDRGFGIGFISIMEIDISSV